MLKALMLKACKNNVIWKCTTLEYISFPLHNAVGQVVLCCGKRSEQLKTQLAICKCK